MSNQMDECLSIQLLVVQSRRHGLNSFSYEVRAVAFVDVLGFRQLVHSSSANACCMNRLSHLVRTLQELVKRLDLKVDRKTVPAHLIPRHNQISDSIVLSAPLRSDEPKWKNYNGLEILAMRVCQITHVLLDEGYLVSGGIDVGDVWHTDTNIVGPAYQNAYTLEAALGHPCVQLSVAAAEIAKPIQKLNRLILNYDGRTMVNGLFDAYIQRPRGTINQTYKDYRSIIDSNVNILSGSARDKWIWFGDALKAESKIVTGISI